MTLGESIKLVLTALDQGVGGEVFVKKMPAHTIGDLVEVMTEKHPKTKVKTIGTRPGEKVHEALISPSESIRTIEMGDYFVILPQISVPAIEKKYKNKKRLREFHYTSENTQRLSKARLRNILRKSGWV